MPLWFKVDKGVRQGCIYSLVMAVQCVLGRHCEGGKRGLHGRCKIGERKCGCAAI